jgi:hypothetical protein
MTPEQKTLITQNNLVPSKALFPADAKKLKGSSLKTTYESTSSDVKIKTSYYLQEDGSFYSSFVCSNNGAFSLDNSYTVNTGPDGKLTNAKNIPLGNNQFFYYRCSKFDDKITDNSRPSNNHCYIYTKDNNTGAITRTVDLTIDKNNKITAIDINGTKAAAIPLQATNTLQDYIIKAEDLAENDKAFFEDEFRNREKPKKSAQINQIDLNGLQITGIEQPSQNTGGLNPFALVQSVAAATEKDLLTV